MKGRTKGKWSSSDNLQIDSESIKGVSDVTPLQGNQTIRYSPRLFCFFTTSTISGIPAKNAFFQYRIPRSGRHGKTTVPETSTKSSKGRQAFSRPYHGPRQCGEDNHPPASLQYNGTAENFQSGGPWGIPCSRHHHLALFMWIDWLIQAQPNYRGNVDLQPLLLFTEGVAESGAWYWEWNDIQE